ncbi:MAG TPA: hypothetical protein VMW09_01695, partial [Desulfatiglandales bacterium]|nr:hypothetical protein [Desulfatiglandales bacterium]
RDLALIGCLFHVSFAQYLHLVSFNISSSLKMMVEMRGIEPLTCTLRTDLSVIPSNYNEK